MKPGVLAMFFVSAIMAQTVSLKAPDYSGLAVLRATDVGAHQIVASALGPEPSPEIVDLLPYSVVLRNDTGHTICGYTIRLSFVDAAGRSGGLKRQYFNFESTSNGMEIPPGTARLVTPVFSMGPDRMTSVRGISGSSGGLNEALSLKNRLKSQTAVAVSVDLVVLDTGQVIGPDEGNTLSYLEGYLIGEREGAALVRTAFSTGGTLRQVSDQLEIMVRTLQEGNTAGAFDRLARAAVAKRLLKFAAQSQEALLNEVNRILAKPPITLHR